jgi:hypothetical protein
MEEKSADHEIVVESKWPNGITVTTVILADHAEEVVKWPAQLDGTPGRTAAFTRPLTANEHCLRSQCVGQSLAVGR